ncbi:MAG: hypothetical protein HW416_2287 [Chloroflexi bacterium]|nr:hypothetical protein [Chloroflexota bacterium]
MQDPATGTSPVGAAAFEGSTLRAALRTASAWLDRHVDALNALNVFPVPDGDTGLNMSLTLQSAVAAAEAEPDASLKAIAQANATGALMGARGNSGVILAQMMRAMSGTLAAAQTADASVMAAALFNAAVAARGAVDQPVEGTILTVARAAGDAALNTAAGGSSLLKTLEAAHDAARIAVAETPDLLPILKEASVVDAGGEGYRIFLEGLVKYLRGEAVGQGSIPVGSRADLSSLHQESDDFYGYCTEVLFRGAELDASSIRETLQALGSCVLVVGDKQLVKVHVHTLRPGSVLDMATSLGEIVKVKVDNMQLQHEEFTAKSSRAIEAPTRRAAGVGLVAVAIGDGMRSVFESLGAQVVHGGRTMNPSVKEITAAVLSTPYRSVIIMPNDRNVALAARQAAALASDQTVAVVPTRNMPQGIAAALALNPEADLETNVNACKIAADRCHCIEITHATKESQIGGLSIKDGSLLAVLDDEPVSSGDIMHTVMATALKKLPSGAYDIGTVYVGSRGDPTEAQAIADQLASCLDIGVDVQPGGQEHYQYIVSVE